MTKKVPIKKFSLRLIVFTIIMAALTVIFQIAVPKYSSPALPFIVLFFFVISELTLYIVLRDPTGKKQKNFISSYMLSRVIKFMSILIFLLLYIMLNMEDAWNFAIAFFLIYIMYAVFEVFVLKKENTRISKGDKENKETEKE